MNGFCCLLYLNGMLSGCGVHKKKSAPVKVGADSEYGVVYGLTDNNLLAVYDVDALLKLVQFFCIRIAKNAYAIDTINIE